MAHLKLESPPGSENPFTLIDGSDEFGPTTTGEKKGLFANFFKKPKRSLKRAGTKRHDEANGHFLLDGPSYSLESESDSQNPDRLSDGWFPQETRDDVDVSDFESIASRQDKQGFPPLPPGGGGSSDSASVNFTPTRPKRTDVPQKRTPNPTVVLKRTKKKDKSRRPKDFSLTQMISQSFDSETSSVTSGLRKGGSRDESDISVDGNQCKSNIDLVGTSVSAYTQLTPHGELTRVASINTGSFDFCEPGISYSISEESEENTDLAENSTSPTNSVPSKSENDGQFSKGASSHSRNDSLTKKDLLDAKALSVETSAPVSGPPKRLSSPVLRNQVSNFMQERTQPTRQSWSPNHITAQTSQSNRSTKIDQIASGSSVADRIRKLRSSVEGFDGRGIMEKTSAETCLPKRSFTSPPLSNSKWTTGGKKYSNQTAVALPSKLKTAVVVDESSPSSGARNSPKISISPSARNSPKISISPTQADAARRRSSLSSDDSSRRSFSFKDLKASKETSTPSQVKQLASTPATDGQLSFAQRRAAFLNSAPPKSSKDEHRKSSVSELSKPMPASWNSKNKAKGSAQKLEQRAVALHTEDTPLQPKRHSFKTPTPSRVSSIINKLGSENSEIKRQNLSQQSPRSSSAIRARQSPRSSCISLAPRSSSVSRARASSSTFEKEEASPGTTNPANVTVKALRLSMGSSPDTEKEDIYNPPTVKSKPINYTFSAEKRKSRPEPWISPLASDDQPLSSNSMESENHKARDFPFSDQKQATVQKDRSSESKFEMKSPPLPYKRQQPPRAPRSHTKQIDDFASLPHNGSGDSSKMNSSFASALNTFKLKAAGSAGNDVSKRKVMENKSKPTPKPADEYSLTSTRIGEHNKATGSSNDSPPLYVTIENDSLECVSLVSQGVFDRSVVCEPGDGSSYYEALSPHNASQPAIIMQENELAAPSESAAEASTPTSQDTKSTTETYRAVKNRFSRKSLPWRQQNAAGKYLERKRIGDPSDRQIEAVSDLTLKNDPSDTPSPVKKEDLFCPISSSPLPSIANKPTHNAYTPSSTTRSSQVVQSPFGTPVNGYDYGGTTESSRSASVTRGIQRIPSRPQASTVATPTTYLDARAKFSTPGRPFQFFS